MKKTILLPLVLCCLGGTVGFLAADDKAKEAAIKQDRKTYEGTWRIIRLQVDGKEAEEKDAKKLTVVNHPDGRWSIQSEGKEILKGTSQIDPTQKPKSIDFTPSEGQDAGKEFLGIYEIKADDRKLCFAPTGKTRPSEFTSNPGSGHILVVFQREKP